MCFKRVVLPAPRKPDKRSTGSLHSLDLLVGGSVVRRRRTEEADAKEVGTVQLYPPWFFGTSAVGEASRPSGVFQTARPWGGRVLNIHEHFLRDPRRGQKVFEKIAATGADIGLRRKYPRYLWDRIGWLEAVGPDALDNAALWFPNVVETSEEEGLNKHGLPPLSVQALLVNPRRCGYKHGTVDFGDLSSFAGCCGKWADEAVKEVA